LVLGNLQDIGVGVIMKQWYVIQVYAGYEDIVKADIKKRIEEQGLEHLFGEVLIPSAKMKQFFEAGDALQDQQLFPGYMLIEMEAVPQALRLVEVAPRVLRFLGGKNPIPLSQAEINRVLGQMRGEVVVATKKYQFEVGKEIEITQGAFAGFVGIIDAIDEENEKLTVMVSIFGRMTPVELSFDQVKH
jgi:transcription termination/antitermination protein NusG